MPDRIEPTVDRKVAFRPAGIEVHDRVIAEHSAGHVDHVVDIPARPGAVPPPLPTGHVPRESLAARLRALIEEG